MINFKSEEVHEISGRGTVYVVRNPIISDEWAWVKDYSFLYNTNVLIDGKEHTVIGVEAFAYGGSKRRAYDPIGLLVK